MKRVIILDDNHIRQKDEYIGKTFEEYDEVLYNAIESRYIQAYNKLKNGEVGNISDFEIVIVHESAFDKDEEIFDLLQDYCKKFKKKLIYFSGGISTIGYGSTTNIMYIPSKILYKNLSIFLEDESLNVKILAYGKNWKINVLNNVLKNIKKLYREFEAKPKIRTRIFKKKVGYDMLEGIIPPLDFIEKDFLELDDLDRMITIIKNEMDF